MDWKRKNRSILSFLLLTCINFSFSYGKVLELSDRFLEVYRDGAWFVMFYAPWCGHCKKLEPVWDQVAQSLYPPVIRVAQVDCTRFQSVATEFKVKGFPTLIFMKNGETFHYKGERTREALVDYAERMALPPIQAIGDPTSMKAKIKSKQNFFLYVGENEGTLWEMFNQTAHEYQPHIYFYSVSLPVLQSSDIKTVEKGPSVLVFKDDNHYVYLGNADVDQLRHWVNHERFPSVVEIGNGNFHQVLKIKKYIVLAVLEEDKVGRMTRDMQEYKKNYEQFAHKYRDIYHENFLFGWTVVPELANSVAMMNLPLPSLIVINATNYLHHIPEEHMQILTPETLAAFLDSILLEEVQAFGGTGILARANRMYYEGMTTLSGMWYGNPVLTSVLFGLPLGFLSLICYSMWCSDIMDSNEEENNVREKED